MQVSAPNTMRIKLAAFIVPFSVIAASLMFVSSAYAATPTLSAYATGNGDYVQLNISGDPSSSVVMSYLNISSTVQQSVLGSTNSSGSFSTTVSTSAYGVTPNSLFYVTVNGQRSDNGTWPYGTASSSNSTSISLSQASVTLSVGQSSIITASNTSGSSMFQSSNSTPSVANVSFSGNQITVSANTYGSTTITVCLVNSSSDCANFSVTVPNSSAQSITFSQSTVAVPQGQNIPVTISGGTGTYTISNNSNSSLIQATLNGSTVSLYSTGSTGSAVITICSTNMSSCGVITANAGTQSSVSVISFSPQSPTLSPGQTTYVTVSGGSGTYYISSNPNTSVLQAGIVGSTITLFGNANGTVLLNICASSGGCSTLTVTVNAVAVPVTLSQTSLTLPPGQTTSVSISGSGGYYVSSNSSQAVATATVNGNILSVLGVSSGATYINVCETGSQCTSLYVTVSGSTQSINSSSSPQLNLIVGVGQTIYVSFSGGSTPYYLSSNPGTVFNASLNLSTVAISGVSIGNSSVNVCSSTGNCTPIYVYVISNQSATATGAASTSSGGSSNVGGYKFNNYLYLGLTNKDVKALQERLTSDGIYSGPITGYYGKLTEAAVKKYQAKHGLSQLGVVGPATRALLNSGK